MQQGGDPDFAGICEAWPVPAAAFNRHMIFAAANTAFQTVTRHDPASLTGRPLSQVLSGQADHVLADSLHHVLQTGRPHHLTVAGYGLAGAEGTNRGDRPWTITNIPLLAPDGSVAGILHCPLDVDAGAHRSFPGQGGPPDSMASGTDPAAEQEEKDRLHQLFRQAPGFICVLKGPKHVYELANDAYFQLVGHRDIIGQEIKAALPEIITQGYMEKLDGVYRTGQSFVGRALPIKLQRTAGAELEQRYIDLVYQPIFNPDRTVAGIFVQGHDVTEAFILAQEVAFQAAHDALTGLMNRREFSRLTEVVQGTGPHALLYMDIDHFKIVNDRCGHAAGDSLLREVAAALTSVVGTDALLARLGGDEFALMMPNLAAEPAVDLAQQLRAAVKGINFAWRDRQYNITLSVGVSTFDPADGQLFDSALGLADAACFLAKEAGRNRVKLAEPSDDEIWRQLAEMDNLTRLKEAIRDDRIVLHGQQIIGIDGDTDRHPRFYEILARLRDTNGQLVPPAEFIPAAERFGLIEELDRHIVAKAFRHLAGLDPDVHDDVSFFVNISGVTLAADSFTTFVEELLAAHPELQAKRICFEVTETVAISDVRRSAEAMKRLGARGVRFALDDFGSGMASFAYLQQLPVQYVKIDGEFVRSVLDQPSSAIIVQSVAKLAECMGIRTIAESVESLELVPALRELGVDYAQGCALHFPEVLGMAVRQARPASA